VHHVAAAHRLGELWRRCDALLARPEPAVGRVVCVFSDLRGISACGPAGGASDARAFLDRYRTEGEAAFDAAERLLAGPG
jgi:hypothetical protein